MAAAEEKINIETLLPERPLKIKDGLLRARLIEVMQSQGEILPSADSALGRLWRLVHSDDSTVDQCVDIIALDPALTARVFRVANSSAFHAKAATLAEAVIFLGFSRLRQVVFSAGIFDQFCKLKLPEKWDHFWIRNIFISRLTERIVADYFRPNGSEYLAGLLHDTGWLLLAGSFPEELDQILLSTKANYEAEIEALSFNHADVSAMICARSGLPLRVVRAVAQHQRPSLDPLPKTELPRNSSRFLAVILSVCDRLACACEMPMIEGEECTLDAVIESPQVAWLKAMGLKTDLQVLIKEELPKAKEIFAIFFRNN